MLTVVINSTFVALLLKTPNYFSLSAFARFIFLTQNALLLFLCFPLMTSLVLSIFSFSFALFLTLQFMSNRIFRNTR